jgi:serine/threonine protein kinase
MIGKTRGDYTVQKDVGKGTFGQVYQVTRTDQIPTSLLNKLVLLGCMLTIRNKVPL